MADDVPDPAVMRFIHRLKQYRHKEGVGGSSPSAPTTRDLRFHVEHVGGRRRLPPWFPPSPPGRYLPWA